MTILEIPCGECEHVMRVGTLPNQPELKAENLRLIHENELSHRLQIKYGEPNPNRPILYPVVPETNL